MTCLEMDSNSLRLGIVDEFSWILDGVDGNGGPKFRNKVAEDFFPALERYYGISVSGVKIYGDWGTANVRKKYRWSEK